MCGGEQRVPRRDIEDVPEPDTAARVGLFCDRNQRQRRRFGELGHPLGPPLPVLVGGSRVGCRQRGPVLAIGVAQFGQFPAAVEHREVGHELPVAHRVGGVHVHVDVQPRTPVRTQRQAQFQHVAVEQLVRLLVTNGFQPLLGRVSVQLAQVVHRDGQASIADALRTVGQDLHAQHRMPRNQFRRRVPQPLRIHVGTVELDIKMGGDAAELLIVVATQPHGVLHRRQRKWIAGIARPLDAVTGSDGCSVTGPFGHQRRPRRHGGVLRQGGEVDVDALFSPAPGQRHHPNGIETRGDEVGVRVDDVGAHAEEFGNLVTDGADERSTFTIGSTPPGNTHAVLQISTGCPN